MSLKNKSEALIASLEVTQKLAEGLISEARMSGHPVRIEDLPGEIESRMSEYGLSIPLLMAQSGASKNSVYKAMRNPEDMRISTLNSIIEPLGLSVCFAKL